VTLTSERNAALDAPIRVALVEDEPGTRDRLRAALSLNTRMRLVFEAGTALEISQWLRQQSPKGPEVLLVDLGLPDRSGFSVIEEARVAVPNTDILVVSMFGDEANMIHAFESGAKGYLLKDGTHDDLAAHVMHLHEGGSPMSPIIARQLIARFDLQRASAPEAQSSSGAKAQTKSVARPHERVSTRELEVLRLISRGYTYPEIAKLLEVSVHTIHTHVRNIYSKLAVKTKTEAVFEARNLGLLE
jgi:DNA-binding NarL/FixJ family response regulator